MEVSLPSPVELHVILVPLDTVQLVLSQSEVADQPEPLPDLVAGDRLDTDI